VSEVVCLSRGKPLPSGALGGAFKDKGLREAQLAFLAAKARWPGAGHAQRMAGLEGELATMTLAEKVMLDIDMRARERNLHSFEYDPLAYGRG
jgi:hypothetical protein